MSWFSQTSIGIHVADNEIDFVVLEKKRRSISVKARKTVLLAEGTVHLGRIQDPIALKDAFAQAFHILKTLSFVPKRLVFSLPESQVYTHIIPAQAHIHMQDRAALIESITANVPIAEESLVYTVQRRAHHAGGDNILVAATEQMVLAEWRAFFEGIGYKIDCFDIEALGNFRSLFHEQVHPPLAIIDMGSWTTHVAIFDQLGLQYTHTIKSAGTVFTCHIAEHLGISVEEAELKKKEHGLLGQDLAVQAALMKIIDPILAELKDVFQFVETHFEEHIETCMLLGGSSQLPGLHAYMETALGRTIQVPDAPLLVDTREGTYSAALGAALRVLKEDKYGKDLAFFVTKKHPAIEKKGKKRDPFFFLRRMELLFLMFALVVAVILFLQVI